MPAQVGALYVSLTMDSRPYTTGMARAEAVTSRAARAIERDVGVAHKSILGLTGSAGSRSFRPHALMAVSRSFENAADRSILLRSSLLSLTAVAGGFTAALSSNLLSRYADTFTQLTNQIRTVTDSSTELGAVQNALAGVAERSRAGLQATTTLYARTARATEHLGTTQQDLLRITETVQKAFSIGGASSAEAAGAAIQLSQGIASDRFSGEEFRSVAENAPVLLRGMAESLDVTIGKLREMAHAGELTADVVTKAILQSGVRIEKEFASTAVTVDRALGQVDNQLITYIGNADKANGVSTLLAQGILAFGNNLDSIIPTITTAAAAVGALMVARNKMLLGGSIGALAGGAAGFGLGGIPGMLVGAGIGGFAGGQSGEKGGGFIAQIKTEAKEARDRVIALRQEQERLKASNLEARKMGYAAKNASEIDKVASASAALQKQYARDAAAIEKLDMRKLAVQDEMRTGYERLAQVNASLSPRNVRLADAQIEAEQRLQQTLKERRDLQRSMTQVTTRETAALGLQSTFVGKLRTLTEATKARAVVSAQLADNEKEASANRIALANREMQINKEADGDAKRMLTERMAIQRKLNSLLNEQNSIDQKRTTSVGVARGSRSEAEIDGQRRVAEQITQSRVALQASNIAIAENEKQLASATRSASRFGQAMSLAGRAGGAVLGALGGPAGVAIMATVGALGYLAQRANEARVKTEKLKTQLRDLGLLADDASVGVENLNVSLEDMTTDQLSNELSDIKSEIEKLKQEQNFFDKIFGYDASNLGNLMSEVQGINTSLAKEGALGGDMGKLDSISKVGGPLMEIIRLTQDGKLTADQLKARLDSLSEGDPRLAEPYNKLISTLRDAIPFMDALLARQDQLTTQLSQKNVDTKWIDEMIAKEKALADARASGSNFQSAVQQLQADASMSEEDTRVAETTDKIIKAWQAINEEKGLSVSVSRVLAEIEAKNLIAIEDAESARREAAAKAKKDAEDMATFMNELNAIQQELAEREVSLVDGEAARRVQFLVSQFEEGRIGAEEVKTQLQAIAGMDISGGMRSLISNIVSAMGPLQGLLNMFGKLPGAMSGGTGDRALPGPVYGRGALARSRRALAEAKSVTDAYAEEQVRVSGLSTKQADLESKIQSLISDTPATGAPLNRDQAEAIALRMQTAEDQVSAAEAARKKAEGGGGSESSFDRAISGLKEKTAALQLEASMQGMATAAIDKAKLIQELENAAKEDSIGLTAERVATIQQQADAYMQLEAATEAARKKQEELDEAMSFYKETFTGFFQEIGASLRNGEDFWSSFADAALNALGKIADRMISMAADGLFDILAKGLTGAITGGIGGGALGNGIGGGISGAFQNGALRFAGGGPVVGSGSGQSDSIMARLSNGEFVVNAKSARAFRPLLDAINDNAPGFAAGTPSMPGRPNLAGIAKAVGAGADSQKPAGNVFHIDARGSQRGVGEEIRDALQQYDKNLPDRMNQIRQDPRKRT